MLQKFSLYSVVDKKKYAREERSYKYCRESIIYFKVKKKIVIKILFFPDDDISSIFLRFTGNKVTITIYSLHFFVNI